MNDRHVLSDVWLKASILGAIWAASEIILGSFLHNLNIPFKGNILTAIGLILMISVAYKWKDRGLFWRSGLICAVMKTMSPSAVLLGPMVAIVMEALLLDISVRLLGRNLAGFFLGSALAMSWILTQKIINYIIYYGNNIVEIYANVLNYAEQQLNLQFDIFWLPVLILLAVYILFGLFAAAAGVKMARSIAGNQDIRGQVCPRQPVALQNNRDVHFPYSTSWLILSFAGLVMTFILINKSPIYIWIPVSVLLITLWVSRYKRAMRQLSRPRFWIFFVVITVLSAVLISSLNGSQSRWTDGLIIGLQMNFRAAVVIVGFSALGTELYNPGIRNFLAKSTFKQLPAALELAFESLPFVVANLPDAKTFIKKPADVMALLISYTEDRFNALKKQQQAPVFIITGDVSEGKTGFLVGLLQRLRDKDLLIGGFYAPRIMQDGKTLGYDLVFVETDNKLSFLRIKQNGIPGGIGKYEINAETLEQGKSILSAENSRNKDVVIIDEIGRLELQGHGWSSCLENLLAKPALCLILSIRKDILNLVLEKFEIRNPSIYSVSEENMHKAETSILNNIFHKEEKQPPVLKGLVI
ncbi:MAG: hypothetical protein JW830_08355 [Bacteroidales bacterium]|nr:hypothetical protein [Bacteroidales bacterium]